MKLKLLLIKLFGLQHPHDKVVEMFTRYGDHGKLLDAPAGPGVISQKLKEAGFDVAAVDINPHYFCIPGMSCEKADLNFDLPFSNETFDYILCSNGIEHLENPALFIRECFRILKEKGKFLISTPNILNLKSRLANLLVGFNLFTGRPNNEVDDYLGGEHIHLANYYELRTHLHRNGFRILEVTTHSYSHRAMLFAPLYPLVYLATWRAFKRERSLMQRERNKEILRHVLSADLILGRKLFLMAEKDPQYIRGQGAPPPPPSPTKNCAAMSLRGSGTTEAISQGIDNPEIAALPPVARNDDKGIVTQPPRGEGKDEGLKKIRFAIGLMDFSKKKGGAERYLVDLCIRMADEGHEVHVFTEHQDEEYPGISFHSVKTIPFPKSLRLLSFASRATKEMEKRNYDITFGVGNTLKADILQPHGGVHWAWFWRSLKAYDHPALWLLKFFGRILSPKQWISGWIEDAPYKKGKFAKIIAISEMVKRDMIRWYQIPEENIIVVYNGVDIEHFHPRNRQYREEIRKRHGIHGEDWVILFVSNNFRMKGLGFLIKALAKMKKENPSHFKLLILGRDHQDSYLHLAREKGILEEVVFAGSTNEPEKYYGASDLLVHPTFYDACSLTVLEALASGLPVITTQFNGASGIITQGQEGFVISDPREDQVLVEKISFFLDREKIERASIAARHLAESYSLERNWSEMNRIFQNNFTEGAIRR